MNRTRKQFAALAATLSALLPAATLLAEPAAHAVPSDAAPNQASCDNGSVTVTWASLGIARPLIASMTVDGEVIPDPANPADGSIGAAVCANTDLARKTGLMIVRRSGMNFHQDLTGAVTPLGHPITADSDITVTLTDLGDLARYYTFSLVYGTVDTWTTSGLGTAAAALSFTAHPAARVLVSGSGDSAFCSATPPVCNAAKSDADILGLSIDMDLDQTDHWSDFRGAYYSMVSATSAFVEPVTNPAPSLKVTIGAPHMKSDGTTLNEGAMSAFVPDHFLDQFFGLTSAEMTSSSLAVTRTEGGHDSVAPWTYRVVPGGIVVTVEHITFSSPVYTIASGASPGYWMLEHSGRVHGFGSSTSADTTATEPAVAIERVGTTGGYWVLAESGHVLARNGAPAHGNVDLAQLTAGERVSSISGLADGSGYWVFTDRGRAVAFGAAQSFGDLSALSLNGKIVASVATPSGKGYWMIAADGGVFAFGDAQFSGSTGDLRLNQPVVGLAPDPDGTGYWLVASDGGIFAFGADYRGSIPGILAAGQTLNQSIIGAVAYGNGYLMVASDGGIFSFSDQPFLGSLGATPPATPIVDVAVV